MKKRPKNGSTQLTKKGESQKAYDIITLHQTKAIMSSILLLGYNH